MEYLEEPGKCLTFERLEASKLDVARLFQNCVENRDLRCGLHFSNPHMLSAKHALDSD